MHIEHQRSRIGRPSRVGPIVSVALLTAALTAVLACGSVPKRYYYALSYPTEAPGVSSRPPLHPYRLRIKPFSVALPYNRPQIVYRTSPFEFNYYSFRMWSAKPQHMLRELTERHIQEARLVSNVSLEYMDQLPDYELSAEVLAIEEYDSGDVWYGHLEMRYVLTRFSDQTVVWTYRFDRKRKVYEKDPVYVVRAVSRIVEEEMNRITAQLDAVFSAERGVAPTLLAPTESEDDTPTEGRGGLVVPDQPGTTVPKGADDDLIVPDEPSTGMPAGGR